MDNKKQDFSTYHSQGAQKELSNSGKKVIEINA